MHTSQKTAFLKHVALSTILIFGPSYGSNVKPPAEDDICIINLHKSKQRRSHKREPAVDDEEELEDVV